ncbi:MAG: hypothetical protein KGJ93_00385 [Patescibacteria group bacterium]|nr:hypothetical protein [Patescibacteria group bacterium]
MDAPHLQKIQGSVNSAAILSAGEKAEWLQLMGIMNDRQLLELERILTEAASQEPKAKQQQPNFDKPQEQQAQKTNQTPKPAVVAAPVQTVAAPSPSQPAPRPASEPAKPGAEAGVGFSHILNFPKGPGPTATPKAAVAAAPSAKPSFMDRLKAVVAEKELPPGSSLPLAPTSASKPAAPPAEKPKPAAPPPATKTEPARPSGAAEKPEAKKPQPPKAPAVPQPPKPRAAEENITINVFVPQAGRPVSTGEPASELARPGSETAAIPAAVTNVEYAPVETQVAETALAPEARAAKGQAGHPTINVNVTAKVADKAEEVRPGLNFSKVSLEKVLYNKESGEPANPLSVRAAPAKLTLVEKTGDDMQLETLQQTSALKAEDLRQHATATMLRKLQKLGKQSGPHALAVALEQSPLYRDYIASGAQWLNGKADVEAALSKEEFEQFADLLIALKSKM